MCVHAITVDDALLGRLADEVSTIAAAYLDLMEDTAVMRLMNANHILVYEDNVSIKLTTTHVLAILVLRGEIVTLTSIIASHRHVSMEIVQTKLVATAVAARLVTLDYSAKLT